MSQSVVAIRLRELSLLTSDETNQALRLAALNARRELDDKQKKADASKGGPPHHRTHLRNLGQQYVSTVLDAVNRDVISDVDATYYLDAKFSVIQRMEAEMLARAKGA